MRAALSHAIEDYLKAIYELTASGESASTNDLASRLEITPASVTGMIKRLSSTEPPLVEYKKHRGVILTAEGRSVALEIIRHHRLLELFLHETLGYTWDEVHEEADRLEHVISEEMEERIAQALGNPAHDPHGEPIPTRDLRLPPISDLPLSDLRPGQKAKIEWVDASDMELLRYLSTLCLVPKAEITVLEYSPYDQNLRLQVEDCSDVVVLGPKVTNQIYVILPAE
jgi:DtxR family transcriptional regulator, Mn-dependent transcriptional regulator